MIKVDNRKIDSENNGRINFMVLLMVLLVM